MSDNPFEGMPFTLIHKTIPDGWECWKKPPNPTALDLEIEKLIERPIPPRISRDLDMVCPFLYVRREMDQLKEQVSRSSSRAKDFSDERAVHRATLKRVEHDLQEAVAALQRSFDLLELGERDVPFFAFMEEADRVARIGSLNMLEGAVAVARAYAEEGLENARLLNGIMRAKPAMFDKRAFIARVGQMYFNLTGRTPARGPGPFTDFASAAFDFAYPDGELGDLDKMIRNLDWTSLKTISED